MRDLIVVVNHDDLDKKMQAGFNHTYEIKIKISNIPQPVMKAMNELHDFLKVFCKFIGAKLKWSEQND